MTQIVIDGERIETSPGKTVIQAAYDSGMQIPHFCWHPELSIAGNCRMCLVEVGFPKKISDGTFEKDSDGNPSINYFPKLQIACATFVSDGMHIRLNTAKVKEAQEAVMEFLLINHPLDCPICDEAGQCKLQEYAFIHSAGESRFEETKNHKDKRVPWGPNVLFDGERCISCSRCIRFAKEVANQDVLTFVQRGDHVTIQLFEGTQFDNPYSMNVIDICPVGALTSPDFRFKSRVWDMSFNNSICPGCARGCNIQIGVRNNEILRLEPRTNMQVNKYWMCDYGRLTQYPFVNNKRITEPMMKGNDAHIVTNWQDAIQNAADRLKQFKPNEIMFLASPKASCEDIYALNKFVKDVIKSKNIDYLRHTDESFEDNMLRVKSISANEKGCDLIIGTPQGIKALDLVENIKNGTIKALYIMDEDFSNHPLLSDAISGIQLLIIHSSNHSKLSEKADIIFPAATYAESEGTYINIDGRVQHFAAALVTKENLRYMGMKMSRLDKFGADNDRWTHHEQRNCKQSWRIVLMLAKAYGEVWNFRNSSEVFAEMTLKYEKLNGMSYELLDRFDGLLLGKASNPESIGYKYESHYLKPN
jgi:NADH-quinone oxidoreductase subunit G